MPDNWKDEKLPADLDISDTLADLWNRPLAETLTVNAGKALGGAEARAAESTAGCFDFADGTLQGWTLDQLYGWREVPTKADPTKTEWQRAKLTPFTHYLPGQGFTLGNHQKLALSASVQTIYVLDPKVEVCDIFLESPDLSADPHWAGATGFRIDLHRFFCISWFKMNNPKGKPPFYTAQLQMRVRKTDKATGKVLVSEETGQPFFLYGEYDPVAQQFIGHAIDHDRNYRLTFAPAELAAPPDGIAITLLQLRVRCRFPGYVGPGLGEGASGGPWLIGNVCPAG
ncbi:MAG: hypothetical protein JKP98_04270 [Rhodobacteraceae bacterium]|jgi:hypothetical protein|nr:hypothetical protein [Paracoccaceae bacterium]